MSQVQSNLSSTGFDYVVAVTQDSINGALEEMLYAGQPEVVLCYAYDESDPPNLVPIDHDALVTAASGTDPFTVPAGTPGHDPSVQNLADAGFAFAVKAKLGLPPGVPPASLPPIIGLRPGQSNVTYTVTFSELAVAEIVYGPRNSVSWFSQTQPHGTSWNFSGTVDLDFQDTAFSALKPDVQGRLKDIGDPGMFGVKQLYYDLNSSALVQGFVFDDLPSNSALNGSAVRRGGRGQPEHPGPVHRRSRPPRRRPAVQLRQQQLLPPVGDRVPRLRLAARLPVQRFGRAAADGELPGGRQHRELPGPARRTHQVLKNYIRQFVAASTGSVADIRAGLQNSFTQAQGFISSWASLSATMPPGLAAGTASGSTRSAAALPGQDSPQSNWGTQLLRSNAAGSSMPAGGDLGADVLAAIAALGAAIDRERDVLQPFPDDATTAALIGAPDFATIQRIRNPPKAVAMATEFAAVAPRSATDPGDPTDPDSTLTKNLVLSSAILALFGEYAVNIIGSIRRDFPESARLLALGAVFYLPYNAPTFFGDMPNLASGDDTTWPDWMNLTMTTLMAIKAAADIGIVMSPAAEAWAEAEPWIDGAICLVWMAPTIASAYYAANPEPDPTEPPESDTAKAFDTAVAVLNGIAGLAFCLNGTLAPAQALAKDPVTVVAVDSTAAALNHTWGLLSVAAAMTGYAKHS